jgi:hypothetical protein
MIPFHPKTGAIQNRWPWKLVWKVWATYGRGMDLSVSPLLSNMEVWHTVGRGRISTRKLTSTGYRQLAAGFRPRFTIHDSRSTIHGPRSAVPSVPKSRSPEVPASTHPPVFLPHPLPPPLRFLPFCSPFPCSLGLLFPAFYPPPGMPQTPPPCRFVKL